MDEGQTLGEEPSNLPPPPTTKTPPLGPRPISTQQMSPSPTEDVKMSPDQKNSKIPLQPNQNPWKKEECKKTPPP